MVMRHFSRRRHPEKRKPPSKWVVVYGGMSVECSDEASAKNLAAKLRRKGYRLAARTAEGVSPSWRIDPEELDEWLSRETKLS
ncbi:hypothetical protein ACVWY3_002422 [Bradyrhizobium sp. USDA 4486]